MPFTYASPLLKHATDYRPMFKSLIDPVDEAVKQNPEYGQDSTWWGNVMKRSIDQRIAWAKRVLKKQDRITWYLRWLRMHFVAQWFPEREAAEMKAYNAKAGFTAATEDSSFFYLKAAEDELQHYYSLHIPAIENFSPRYETVNTVLRFFGEVETEWNRENKNKLSLKEGDETFMGFPDGWAWWLLPREFCTAEAKAMGHCGNEGDPKPGDRILSLRQPHKGTREVWEPHLTFILRGNGMLGEMKGKQNAKPSPKYFPYIIALLKDKRLRGILGGGYKPENNFSLNDLTQPQRDEIRAANPAMRSFKERYKEEGRTEELTKLAEAMVELQTGNDMGRHSFVKEWGAWIVSDWGMPTNVVRFRGDEDALATLSFINGEMAPSRRVKELMDERAWSDIVPLLPAESLTLLGKLFCVDFYPELFAEWWADREREGTPQPLTEANDILDFFEVVDEKEHYSLEFLNRCKFDGMVVGGERAAHEALRKGLAAAGYKSVTEIREAEGNGVISAYNWEFYQQQGYWASPMYDLLTVDQMFHLASEDMTVGDYVAVRNKTGEVHLPPGTNSHWEWYWDENAAREKAVSSINSVNESEQYRQSVQTRRWNREYDLPIDHPF